VVNLESVTIDQPQINFLTQRAFLSINSRQLKKEDDNMLSILKKYLDVIG